jgi:hypothetical protein
MFAILPAVYARGGQISEFLGRIPGKKKSRHKVDFSCFGAGEGFRNPVLRPWTP